MTKTNMNKKKVKYLLSNKYPILRRQFLDLLQGKSQYIRVGHEIEENDFGNWSYTLYPHNVVWKKSYVASELIIYRDKDIIYEQKEKWFHSFMVNEQGVFIILEEEDSSISLRQLDHQGNFVQQITLLKTDGHSVLFDIKLCKDHILFVCCGKSSCFLIYDTVSKKHETIYHEDASSVEHICTDGSKIYYTLDNDHSETDSGSSSLSSDDRCSKKQATPTDVYSIDVANGSGKIFASFDDEINTLFVWESELYVNYDNKLWLMKDSKILVCDNITLADESYSQQGEYIVSKVLHRYYSIVKMTPDHITIDPQTIKVFCKKTNTIDCPMNLLDKSSYHESIASGRWKDDKIILPFRMKIIKNWITAMTTFNPSLKCLIHAMMCQDFLCQDELKNKTIERILVEVCMSKKKFIKLLTKYDQEIIDMLKDVIVMAMDVHAEELTEQDYELICNYPSLVMKNHQQICPLIGHFKYDVEQYVCNTYGILVKIK